MENKPDRVRIDITMPKWLFNEAKHYGARRGFGMSENISRLLERFVEEEKAREKVECVRLENNRESDTTDPLAALFANVPLPWDKAEPLPEGTAEHLYQK